MTRNMMCMDEQHWFGTKDIYNNNNNNNNLNIFMQDCCFSFRKKNCYQCRSCKKLKNIKIKIKKI